MENVILGVDIGGTGIKGALVDVHKGVMITDRKKIATPKPVTPNAVLETVKELVQLFDWEEKKMGFGFPCILENGVCHSASNISKDWIGMDLNDFFGKALKTNTSILNDADAAGLAEMLFGAGKNLSDLIITITIGTGIGSGVFYNGQLIPNIEIGSFKWKGGKVEDYVSNVARKKKGLSLEKWAKEFNVFLNHLVDMFSPKSIIIGGGISKKFDDYYQFFDVKRNTQIIPAQFQNGAGVIGAALYRELNDNIV